MVIHSGSSFPIPAIAFQALRALAWSPAVIRLADPSSRHLDDITLR
jgi:hypothetical protein